MNDLENLKIYKQYVELTYYTFEILEKYPKKERFALSNEIKTTTLDGMKIIIKAQKEFSKTRRIEILHTLDSNLKFLKVLIRISHKKKYINNKNYASWSKKLANISNMMGAWIKSCQNP